MITAGDIYTCGIDSAAARVGIPELFKSAVKESLVIAVTRFACNALYAAVPFVNPNSSATIAIVYVILMPCLGAELPLKT